MSSETRRRVVWYYALMFRRNPLLSLQSIIKQISTTEPGVTFNRTLSPCHKIMRIESSLIWVNEVREIKIKCMLCSIENQCLFFIKPLYWKLNLETFYKQISWKICVQYWCIIKKAFLLTLKLQKNRKFYDVIWKARCICFPCIISQHDMWNEIIIIIHQIKTQGMPHLKICCIVPYIPTKVIRMQWPGKCVTWRKSRNCFHSTVCKTAGNLFTIQKWSNLCCEFHNCISEDSVFWDMMLFHQGSRSCYQRTIVPLITRVLDSLTLVDEGAMIFNSRDQ